MRALTADEARMLRGDFACPENPSTDPALTAVADALVARGCFHKVHRANPNDWGYFPTYLGRLALRVAAVVPGVPL